jgi:hypothetical protein
MRRIARNVASASLGILVPLWPALSLADQTRAGVAVAVIGTATVSRVSLSGPVSLRFKDEVFLRDRIDTHENSTARLLLGGKALVTVKQLSEFTITDQPGRAAVDLQKGSLAVGVAKSLLRPGEAVEIRTPNAVVAIRGSLVLVEVRWAGGLPQTEVITLEVSRPVTVTPRDAAATLSLPPHHTTTVIGSGATLQHTPVRPLSRAESTRLEKATGLPVKQHAATLPSQVVTGMLEDAASVATRLGAPPSTPGAPRPGAAEATSPSPSKLTAAPSELNSSDTSRATKDSGPAIPATSAAPTTASPSPTKTASSPTTTLSSPTKTLSEPTTTLSSPRVDTTTPLKR